jgi:hypothetical protein
MVRSRGVERRVLKINVCSISFLERGRWGISDETFLILKEATMRMTRPVPHARKINAKVVMRAFQIQILNIWRFEIATDMKARWELRENLRGRLS